MPLLRVCEVAVATTCCAAVTAVTPDQVVREGHLYDFAQAEDGRLLTVWQRCDADDLHCRYAWQVGERTPAFDD